MAKSTPPAELLLPPHRSRLTVSRTAAASRSRLTAAASRSRLTAAASRSRLPYPES
jgi:hypothetical protein